MDKLKMLTKNKKIMIGALSALLVVGVGGTLYVQSVQAEQQAIEAQKQFDLFLGKVKVLEKDVSAFYTNDQHDFISPALTKEKIEGSKKEVASLTKSLPDYAGEEKQSAVKKRLKQVEELITDVSYKQETEKAVNALFQEKVIQGETIQVDVAIADDLTYEKIEPISISESINKESEWANAVVSALKSATEQVNQIAKATKKVDGFYENKAIIANPTREAYELAQTEINKIKNNKAKKALTDKMVTVLGKIEESEQLVMEQEQEAEQLAKEQAEAVEVAVADVSGNQPLVVTPEEKGESVRSETPPATQGENFSSTTGYNESVSSETATSPAENSSSNSGSESTDWHYTDPITGGDTYGGIYDNLEDIPGLEFATPPWE